MPEGVRRPGGRPRRRARIEAGLPAEATPATGPAPVHARKAREVKQGYVWETARRGNYLGVKSGVQSPRIVSKLAVELADWVVAEFPDLAEPRYRFSIGAWARAESVVGLLVRRLDEVDVFDGDGEPRAMLNALRTAERRAAEARRDLGLSPADHARLETQRSEAVKGAADLSALTRRGREAIEARSREEDE
jgi:hypothetical protein